MTTWMVQTNLIAYDQVVDIAWALKEIGVNFESVEIIPFENVFVEEPIASDPIIIPYGSNGLVKLAQTRGYKGLYFNEDQMRSDVWFKRRSDMMNRDAMILTIAEATKFMAESTSEDPYFVRPINDLKAFAGGLITKQEFNKWMVQASAGGYTFDDSQEIVIASPKNIQAEWRWFLVNGEVIDGSMYRCRGQMKKVHETDPAVIREAQAKADGWLPDCVVVMDLALVNGKVEVIEFNNFNSSGFYKHDKLAILKAVTEFTNSKFS